MGKNYVSEIEGQKEFYERININPDLHQDTDEYDENITYGYWQIKEQINIKIPSGIKDRYGEDKVIIKYPNLNTALLTLDNELKQYYEEYILDDLFKYELLK